MAVSPARTESDRSALESSRRHMSASPPLATHGSSATETRLPDAPAVSVASGEDPRRRILVLCASPRRDGNSRALADAIVDGAHEVGHNAEVVQLDEVMKGLLRDCRSCRLPDGSCGIEDGFAELVHGRLV